MPLSAALSSGPPLAKGLADGGLLLGDFGSESSHSSDERIICYAIVFYSMTRLVFAEMAEEIASYVLLAMFSKCEGNVSRMSP